MRRRAWGCAMVSDSAGRLKSGVMRGVARFARDRSGNVLLMTAAAIVPIIAIVGSGIDIGRAYMADLRLQQACDAGVLAGRRAMGGTQYTADHQDIARQMFVFNFPNGVYGSTASEFESWPGGGADVSGRATATLPTAIMNYFGFEEFDLGVNCGAKMEIANTDVMMVLDVTYSMVMSGNRLSELQRESKAFLTTLMGADVGDGRIRIGVVPYALTVNVGQILIDKNPSWIADNFEIPSMTYVERRATTTTRDGDCIRWTWGGSRRTCVEYQKITRTTYNDIYRKADFPYNVSALKETGSTAGTFKAADFPVGKRGGAVGVTWNGCITEVKTKAESENSAFDLDEAWDMDINHRPDLLGRTGDQGKWKMYLPELAFDRSGTPEVEVVLADNADLTSNLARSVKTRGGHEMGCPTAALPLTEMNASGQKKFTDKIDDLTGHGYTYHDVGMAWGGRLISPRGIMREQNETAGNGKPISRHIIFMTDGNMDTGLARYSHQGLELSMPRVGSTDGANSNARHINRFKRLCNSIKAEGVTIWVIAFGFPAESSRNNDERANFANLELCASPGLMYDADDGAALGEAFQSIAGQISRLRVSQ